MRASCRTPPLTRQAPPATLSHKGRGLRAPTQNAPGGATRCRTGTAKLPELVGLEQTSLARMATFLGLKGEIVKKSGQRLCV
jgi:hypothetical protein